MAVVRAGRTPGSAPIYLGADHTICPIIQIKCDALEMTDVSPRWSLDLFLSLYFCSEAIVFIISLLIVSSYCDEEHGEVPRREVSVADLQG